MNNLYKMTTLTPSWLKVLEKNDTDLFVLPERYDTELPSFRAIEEHTPFSNEDIHNYFIDLDEDTYRNVNEVDESYRTCVCDYCGTECGQVARHCNECNKDMCNLCFSEKTEEIAIKNGAKNWQKRKQALLQCFEHHQQGLFCVLSNSMVFTCDMCTKNDTRDTFGIWHRDNDKNMDVCPPCYGSAEFKAFQQEKDLTDLLPMNFPDRGVGSLYDWVPILLGPPDCESMVLYNMVPTSPYYHKVAITNEDDHGRKGFFVYPGTLEQLLEAIESKLENYREIRDIGIQRYDDVAEMDPDKDQKRIQIYKKYDDSTILIYNNPINHVIEACGFPTHHG